jgi:hypothetical protein
MAKRSAAKQAELKVNYNKLREAGYSPKEASRLRSASPATINQALHTQPKKFREVKPLSEKHARAGGGSGERYKKKESYQPTGPDQYTHHKGRIKNSDYQTITPDSERVFHNTWAYRMTYVTVDRYGIEQRKYFTILPDEKMNKKQLKEFVLKNCENPANLSYYKSKIVRGSIELIGAYYNPNW